MIFHDPRAVLKAHGLWTKKRFGQNFLVMPEIPDRIVRAGGILDGDVVFEIGAGCGTLTRALASQATRLIALEYDRDLVPVARAELAWANHAEVREGNVLDMNWESLKSELGQAPLIYGNLPYHLSSKIILSLIAQPSAWKRACFMLQKEFAQRLYARVGSRESSALTAQCALWSTTTHAFDVPAHCFHPAPKVESSVITMERLEQPSVDVRDPAVFRSVVRALFAQRRKMARKALKSITDSVDELLERAELDGKRRGETFTLEELAQLSRELTAMRSN
ncbi:MAG: 16S rRNA (adenine(1518)-N(6)/adenine(1519)-N(6))-dimethyltransferase RsmA [Bradymonadia bacterium]